MPAAGGRDRRAVQPAGPQPGRPARPPDADDPFAHRGLDDTGDAGTLADQVRQLVRWAEDTPSGDRAELPFEPHPRAWAMVSTTARECPGAFRCPSGRDCFAEAARAAAAEADIVVVNTHLYGAHLASGGAVLPPHDVVVFDEAHEVEDVMTDSLGVEIGPGRFRALAAAARPAVDAGDASAMRSVEDVAEVTENLARVLRPWAGRRVPHRALAGDGDGDAASQLAGTLSLATGRVDRLVDALRRSAREAGEAEGPDARSRRDRVLLAAGHLASDLARLGTLDEDEVAWVDDDPRSARLSISPIDVAPILAGRLWAEVTAVLTSATVPLGLAARLGLPEDATDTLDVGSPFPYGDHALLYVARSLPDRRSPEAEPALHDELELLIRAAGGAPSPCSRAGGPCGPRRPCWASASPTPSSPSPIWPSPP